jgi:CRP-like cAMP-binding protein
LLIVEQQTPVRGRLEGKSVLHFADNGPPTNLLLAALSHHDLAALGEMEAVELSVRQVLETPGKAVPSIYFPRSGLISMVARSSPDQGVEVGMIGFEGMTGISVLMGSERALNQLIVQAPGEALRIPVAALHAAMASSPDIAKMFRRYLHTVMAQLSHTALANGRGFFVQRLARWLLMWHDRSWREDLAVTHDFLGVLLGTRRATVTVALHELEGHGLIRSTRGTIEVLDRGGLEAAANSFYGVPEAEYARLLGSAK